MSADDGTTGQDGIAPAEGDGRPAAPAPARPPGRRRGRRGLLVRGGLVAVVLVGLIQLIPFGRAHSNPAVTKEPSWDSAGTQVLFAKACGDCHSNATTWPWYSDVAPVSWLVTNDVNGGRSKLNVSEWDQPQDEAGDVAEAIQGGEMPPFYYTWMHSSAKLTGAEKQALISGWQATMLRSPPIGGRG